MVIEGNPRYITATEFVPKIQAALDLLKEKAAAAHANVTMYAHKISADNTSGSAVRHSRIDIARDTFDTTLTWLASVLVHEARHLALFKSHLEYEGKDAELDCIGVQIEALRLIGGPQSEITYLLSLNGEHFDVDGDGKYTHKDDRLRSW